MTYQTMLLVLGIIESQRWLNLSSISVNSKHTVEKMGINYTLFFCFSLSKYIPATLPG